MTDGMRPWWLVPDHTRAPTVDDVIVSKHGGPVTWAAWVEHPVWRHRPVLGWLVRHRHDWTWLANGHGRGRADTLHQALEDLLEDALSEYVSHGDVTDRVRGL